jgi:Cu2+-containing amine oxidase
MMGSILEIELKLHEKVLNHITVARSAKGMIRLPKFTELNKAVLQSARIIDRLRTASSICRQYTDIKRRYAGCLLFQPFLGIAITAF